MLSSADAALVARDPILAGLPLLLDQTALAELVGAPVRRRYLRYKHGTSCVLGLDVGGERAFAVAYSDQAGPKLDKTVHTAPEGGVLAVDGQRRVLVARPRADRDLPALAALADDLPRALSRVLPGRDVAGSHLQLLAHKPQRRWVGLLTTEASAPVVLRAHRPVHASATTAAMRVLDPHARWTPTLLGTDRRTGLVAVTFLPGTGLDRLIAAGTATGAQLTAAGAAVAALHRQPPTGLRVRTAEDDAAALRSAASAIGVLRPALAAQADRLARSLSEVLADDRPGPVLVHGDLSVDQVVVDDEGRTGLVDLDAAAAGEPALDLGSALAALHAAAVVGCAPGGVEAPAAALLDGYGYGYGAAHDRRLQAQVAAGLLRRAVEPFRQCRPGWPDEVASLLGLAGHYCSTASRA